MDVYLSLENHFYHHHLEHTTLNHFQRPQKSAAKLSWLLFTLAQITFARLKSKTVNELLDPLAKSIYTNLMQKQLSGTHLPPPSLVRGCKKNFTHFVELFGSRTEKTEKRFGLVGQNTKKGWDPNKNLTIKK